MRAATSDAEPTGPHTLPETVVGAAVLLGVVAFAVTNLVTRGPPTPSLPERSRTLGRLPYESLLLLESPTEPGTPLGATVATDGTVAVRAECVGHGTLTVSLDAKALLAVSCGATTVHTAETQFESGRVEVPSRVFLVAQAGDTALGTRWRVSVRPLSGGRSGGRRVL
jgi:hypothetical protein